MHQKTLFLIPERSLYVDQTGPYTKDGQPLSFRVRRQRGNLRLAGK